MRRAFLTPGVNAEDNRLGAAALLAPGPTALSAKAGVLPAPTLSMLSGPVQPTTPSPTGSVAVLAHDVVVPGLLTATEGPFIIPVDATTVDVFTANPPASQRRNDLVCVKVDDLGGTPTLNTSLVMVTGTPAAVPSDPSLPSGTYLAIARVRVLASSEYAGSPTITSGQIDQLAGWTVARGGITPVRSAAERDALPRYAGLVVVREDTTPLVLEIWNGSAWERTTGGDTGWVSGAANGFAVQSNWTLNTGQARKVGLVIEIRYQVTRTGSAVVASDGNDTNPGNVADTPVLQVPSQFRPTGPQITGTARGSFTGGAAELTSSGMISLVDLHTSSRISVGDLVRGSFFFFAG